MIRYVALAALAAMLAGEAAAETCPEPDHLTSVSGTDHCLQIMTLMPRGGNTETLVVILHGALSRGGTADYMAPAARIAANRFDAVGIAMAQPGYTIQGRTSSGTATRDTHRWYRYRAEKIDSIAAAIANLKRHYRAKRLVLVGHSMGAVNAGVILGRHAPLVDAVVLLACPCDIPGWRFHHDRNPLPHALSPHDFLADAPKSARILALTGQNDRNTPLFLARNYAEKARKLGLDATFVEVGNVGHNMGRGWRKPVEDAMWRAMDR